MDLKQIDSKESTNREKSKVKIINPDVFRDRVKTLKDRISTQFMTQPKPLNAKVAWKSRNGITGAKTLNQPRKSVNVVGKGITRNYHHFLNNFQTLVSKVSEA